MKIIFFCSPPISSEENRTSDYVKTFFLLSTDVFSGKHELLVGTRKNLAFDFSRFWHPDRKKLPTPDLDPPAMQRCTCTDQRLNCIENFAIAKKCKVTGYTYRERAKQGNVFQSRIFSWFCILFCVIQ